MLNIKQQQFNNSIRLTAACSSRAAQFTAATETSHRSNAEYKTTAVLTRRSASISSNFTQTKCQTLRSVASEATESNVIQIKC
jgi:hypothetical protein